MTFLNTNDLSQEFKIESIFLINICGKKQNKKKTVTTLLKEGLGPAGTRAMPELD